MTNTLLGLSSFTIMIAATALWIRAVRRVQLPRNRNMYLAAWIVAAVLSIAALVGSPGWIVGTLAALSLFATTFLILTAAIGAQKVSAHAIQVGAAIPAFTALDEHSQRFDSTMLMGKPALLKFFRGHW